ncbi:MAG: hypothetical protein ABR548_08530 [Actinomycetota bacterium]|nr:hypothetical protein [Actinomycetota bacterium]
MSSTQENEPPSRSITGLPEALSEVPWSADFVMQVIEILPVTLREGAIIQVQPNHADSFIVGWPAGREPADVAVGALSRLGFDPIVVHSTSWRYAESEVVLTYLAVVSPTTEPPASWGTTPVQRSDLARGEATTAPANIAVAQVLEHALRHLSWLTKDDAAIAAALPDWGNVLTSYLPEPFRQLAE